MRRIPFVVFALIVIVSSCQKDEELDTNQCPVSNQTFDITAPDLLNCKYIDSTYWVYIDSVSLQLDSCYIDTAYQGIEASGVCNNSFVHHTFETISEPSMDTERFAIVQSGVFKNVNGVNTGTLIYTDYATAQSMLNYSVNKLDSLFVYDQYYYNVLEVTVGEDASELNDSSVYFVNSDFGILKHEVYQNASLISDKVLKSKNIVR